MTGLQFMLQLRISCVCSCQPALQMLGMKLLMRWLLGTRSNDSNSATSTLRLFYTIIVHEGDLMERGLINRGEKAQMLLQAGLCMLRLAQLPVYDGCMNHEWFQALALLIVVSGS